MRRRHLLCASGTVVATALAGCSLLGGGSNEDEQKIEELRNTIDSQEELLDQKNRTIRNQKSELEQQQTRIDQLETEITQKETRISTLESNLENRSSRISTLETEVTQLKQEKVFELYKLGHKSFQEGEGWMSQAKSSDSNGSYGIAEGQYGIAHGRYLSANDAFERAETVGKQVSIATLASDSIEAAVSATSSYAKAAVNYANEMLFRVQGNTSQANSYESTADSAYAKAQQTTIVTPKTFNSQL